MNLGELEKLVLEYFWQHDEADAKSVHSHFVSRRGGSLNTIQSTLDRLYKKGLLTRSKQGHAFQYRAALQRETFIGKLIKDVTSDFSRDGDSLVSAFATLTDELDTKQLDKLEAMIRSQRESRGESE
jgi:predicted transcriptional regulator